MRHTRFWSVLAIVSAQACAAPVEDLPEGAAEAAAATITEADFMTRVGVIAHDSMLGRNTPSPQLDLTAQYIAGEFERMGLEPGLGNSYIQTYPIRRSRLDTETSGVEFQGATLRFGADAAARRASPTGESGVSGPAVLVTGTTEDPAAFDELDLEGKMVVAITASSQTNTWRRALGAQGPAGMVFVTDIDDENMEGLMNFTTRESVTKGWGEAGAGGRAPMVEVRRSAVQPALEALGVDVADALSNPGALLATPLDDTEITITIVHEILEETTAPNVVAVLEGRDPKLRDEYVVFSGHMDHVGVGNPVNGDSIYN
ncbi:MAG: hypothetical protein OEZ54_08780, partial [Gemmatimonadota bacterium]|nr:hypothetical protein [Gemmatimonadota bacterium]